MTRCPVCGGELESGFLLEMDGGANATRWVSGEPQRNVFGFLTLRGRRRIRVRAHRCTACGLLQLVAPDTETEGP